MRDQVWKWTKLLIFLSVVSTFYCDSKKEQSPVVARVGSEVLTLDMLSNSIPSDLNIKFSEAQIKNYIQRWINSEVLYQEALRQKVHQRPLVAERLKNIQRELIIAIFWDMQVNDEIEVTESEIEVHYNEHHEEFIRPEETRHIWMFLVSKHSEANNIRRQLNRGADAKELATEHFLDPSSEIGGDLGFIYRIRLPKKVGDAAFTLAVGRSSLPIKTDLGYYVVKVVEVRKKDETQELEEVHDLIKERLLIQKRSEGYDQLLALLKESADIQKNFDLVTGLVAQRQDTASMVIDNSQAP